MLIIDGRTEATADEAEAHLRRAESLLKTLAAEFPDVPQYPLELASVEYNLGLLAAKTRHPDAGDLASYKESARLLEELTKTLSGIARLPYATGRLASRPWPDPCRDDSG